MARFESRYLTPYLIGEGLSGFIPIVVAWIQGADADGTDCETNKTTVLMNTDNETNFANFTRESQLLFPPSAFFSSLLITLLISWAAFFYLLYSHVAKRHNVSTLSHPSHIMQSFQKICQISDKLAWKLLLLFISISVRQVRFLKQRECEWIELQHILLPTISHHLLLPADIWSDASHTVILNTQLRQRCIALCSHLCRSRISSWLRYRLILEDQITCSDQRAHVDWNITSFIHILRCGDITRRAAELFSDYWFVHF